MLRISKDEVQRLREKANFLRKDSITFISKGGFGHPGGSLSEAEILSCLYYFPVLRFDPNNPKWDDRDRFVMSKAHGCPPHYVVLCDLGFFKYEDIKKYGCIDSIIQGHPDMLKTPGIEISGGSLGQGLSVAAGMALGAKLLKKKFRIFCLVGDGELQSGQIWEATMSASHYKLDNLTIILDYNKVEAKGPVHLLMGIEPVKDKWKSFGCETIEIDGHDVEEILQALHTATHINLFGKPTVIIAHTIKGRGVSWMENDSDWHTHAPNEDQTRLAIDEINHFERSTNPWIWK